MVTIRTLVHPTEDRAAVQAAVAGLFPAASVAASADGQGMLEATGDDGSHLRELLSRRQVGGAFRASLLRRVEQGSVRFSLSKQAAVVGVATLGTAHPLGDLEVEVLTGDPIGWVQWLTQATGGPVPAEGPRTTVGGSGDSQE